MKKNFIYLTASTLLFLFFTQESFPQTTSNSMTESCNFSEKQIDLNISNLPTNFHGNDTKMLSVEIKSRANLTKDEFETTAQFRKRVEKEKENELTYDSNLAIEINQTKFRYDADENIMNASLFIGRNFVWYSSCQDFKRQDLLIQESMSLDLNFRVEIEKAKKIKPTLRTLLIASLFKKNAEHFESNDLSAIVKEVWLYDLQTGEIFLKQNISEYKKLREQEKTTSKERILSAKNFYENDKDGKALAELRKVLISDPMNAEAYLLLGKIYFRRGELEESVSSLKTAIFWDNQLINAHIELARIYFEKKDCLSAKNYIYSAINIDPENQEVKALQGQIDKCGK